MLILRKCWAFVVKDFRTDVSYRLAFAGQILFTFFMVASFYFFARMIGQSTIPSLAPYGGEYFPFVLVGVAFSSYLDVSIRSFADTIRSAQVLGTLEALITTPTSPWQIVLLSTVYSFVSTSLRVVLTLAIGVFVFDVNFTNSNWPGALLVLALSIVCFSFLGIMSASAVLAFKRADPSGWMVQGLSYLLGGVYYPISVLPGWIQIVAQALPITHSLEAMRKTLLMGASLDQVLPSLLGLLVFALVAGPTSIVLFWLALKRVRREGSLGHF